MGSFSIKDILDLPDDGAQSLNVEQPEEIHFAPKRFSESSNAERKHFKTRILYQGTLNSSEILFTVSKVSYLEYFRFIFLRAPCF